MRPSLFNVGTAPSAATTSSAPVIKVIDLSHHNTVPASLVPTYQAGVRGVIHKATEGTSFVDSKADNRWHLAKEAHLLWGLYHFLRPGDMQRQAEFFWETSQAFSDDNTLLAADHEDPGVSLDDLAEWCDRVKALSGRSPVLYSGHVLKDQLNGDAYDDLSQYRLWLAQYGSSAVMPVGFSSYYLWQYSDGDMGPNPHQVPGVNDPCDCNDYRGTDAELAQTWSGRTDERPIEPPVELPPPTEGATVIDLVVIAPPGVTVNITQKSASG